ncbi:hypothetical protein QF034_008152 [Streptomyces africanus]|uniref:Ricin B lectin domain-containing protein n=1 Tax=Streptomyces africanus TaxID=231024 RepID=A0ABU0R2N6_9ACTN|nr:hypothetical protein [Streptomyces africanus]
MTGAARARSATETRLVFAKGSARMTVHVRTSADGLALRYEMPSGATVLREATSFELPTDAQLSRQVFSPDHEMGYVTSPVADVATSSYDMGMFAQHTNGARVLLAESGVDGGHSGGRFAHTQGTGRFTVTLADAQIARSGAFTTPWRTATIGSTATIVESTLVDDVAPASKVSDTSWIKPGVAAWPWLDGQVATQPHVLTNEAVRGEEYPGGRNIGHVAALPFTRGLLGPADYSPMSFQQSNPNSDAAELALTVLLDSGIMLPGGRISDYQARPEAQRWLRLLPPLWDETKYVSGDPLTGGVIARRSGDRWFVGAFRRGGATISYPTTFLGAGTWHAEITTDGSGGLTRTSKVIKAGDTLSIPALANGGHVVRLTKVPVVPTGNRTVAIAGGSHVLDVRSGSVSDNAEIIRWPSNGGINQRFAFVPLGDGYTRIVNQASGKDVVIRNASRDAGAKVIQYQYEANANTNDEWLAEDAGNGRIRLVNRHSGLYLTAGNAQGDQLEQRPFDGADHQLFTVS